MAGDRPLVREAIAAYFGGTQQLTPQGGIYYQNGPLAAMGLGTVFPYKTKGGAPGPFFTAGVPSGTGWGAVATINLGPAHMDRFSMQWRIRKYTVICSLEVESFEPRLEVAEEGLDELVDAVHTLIYADPALGTTDPVAYPLTGRLITQAGEAPDFITDGEPSFEVDQDRGAATGGITVTFCATTFIVTPAPGAS